MKKPLQWIIVSLSLMVSAVLTAQTTKSRFQHLTIEDGLPQNLVDCMLQDSQGFMWMGTWNGLCRYDGYEFEVYDHTTPGLDETFIYALQEDVFGNIWIGTRTGLHTYIYSGNRFQMADLSAISSEIEVREIVVYKDSLLAVASDQGVTILEPKNSRGAFEVRQHIPLGEKIAGSIVHTVLADSWDNLWMGTDEGLYFYESKTGKVTTHRIENDNGLASNQILALCETTNKDIWVGTEFGFYHHLKSENIFVAEMNQPNDPNSLVHNTVMDIIELDNDRLLIATLGGLSEYNRLTGSFVNYQSNPNADHSLSNDFVNCLLKDESGNLWIGTERGGVDYYNTSQNQIEHYEHHSDEPNSLSVSTINSIYEDDRYLWIGTAGGGLNRYNKSTGNYRHFRYDPNSEDAISSDFVTVIERDAQKRLWVGTWGAGLNILNEATGTFERHQARPGMVNQFVSSLAIDKRSNLWIGTLGGISRYNTREDTYEVIFSDQTATRINNVGCLLFDEANSLWVGSRYGLYHLESSDGFMDDIQVTHFVHNDKDPNSISGNYVISIHQDQQGTIWVGTYGQGINKMIRQKQSVVFESFGTSDGLSNTVIYGIEEDAEGNLWLSTDYGLSRVNTETRVVRNYFKADGFLNNQYYWSAAHENEDGKLYFGGMNGMDGFYPEWIHQDQKGSGVTITDIKLLNESVVPGKKYNDVEVLNESVYNATALNLSYEEKVLGIEFSALNYQEPSMVRYSYILENFEDEWNLVSSNRRYATYTNLKPGNYIFKVKSSSSNGEFNGPVREIAIYIAPPFWDTTWFRGLSLIALIGLVFGYVRYRTYSLKRQKAQLEDQVKERTLKINQQNEALSYQAIQLQKNNDDLETKQLLIEGQNQKLESQNKEILTQRDEVIKLNEKLKLVSQLKLSFFTNISHEFRTPLTLIIGPIEKLLRDKGFSNEVRSTLEVMSRNAQRLLHLINQIMDFRKIEKGRMELNVHAGNIEEFSRNIFLAFEPLAQTKNIDFTFESKDLPEEVWFDGPKMENILYNLLSNAFKYTAVDGRVKVIAQGISVTDSRLNLEEEVVSNNKPVVSIKVMDTGMGISQENLPLVFKRFYRIESEEAFKISGSGIGLALTEELIKTHHGEIFVESELGKGSIFEIQFPCLEDAYQVSELTERMDDSINIHEQVALLNSEFKVEPEEEVASEESNQIPSEKRSTVLVVEDNNDLRKFIAHRLSETYHVLEAVDGAVGVQLAESKSPDLIISDVMMPNVDGLELCGTLKNNLSTSHIPIILLTAKSAVENQIEGLQIGADDYLAKPFNFDLLEARVANLIESREKLRAQFLQFSDIQPQEVTTNIKDQKFIEHAIEVVTQNLGDSEFGVKEFVDQMGISRSLLHKKLTSLANQSAAEFINHQRMKTARKLLQQNELNVSEVAYQVGYNDPKYFSRLFSKSFGQSPKEYANSFLIEG